MADPFYAQRVGFRFLWFVLALVIILGHLLPLHPGSGRIPGPEFLLLLTIAWVTRRPDYVPVWLIAGVFLLADFVFLRPLGLWAAVVVLGSEFLRAREPGWRDIPFVAEWGIVSVVITMMMLVYNLVLTVFFVQGPGLAQLALHLVLTILTYPVAVVITTMVFGIRRVAPGEVDKLGHRQ